VLSFVDHRECTVPRFDVATLLHESAERKPEAVEDGEVVGDRRAVGVVFDVPLERTESTHQEQDDADADIGEDDAHPDLVGERFHKGHDARNVLLRLLEHNADSETHERFTEVDHSFAG